MRTHFASLLPLKQQSGGLPTVLYLQHHSDASQAAALHLYFADIGAGLMPSLRRNVKASPPDRQQSMRRSTTTLHAQAALDQARGALW